MTNLEADQIGKVIRENRFHFQSEGVRRLADYFENTVEGFNRQRWYANIEGRANQPKTGAKCSCKPGQERDNCPQCEATGWVIDFRAIRERGQS